MRAWAHYHKNTAHQEGNSGTINIRCRLPKPYRQVESKSNTTESSASTQLLDERMHDEQGVFRDPRPLTEDDLVRIQQACNPVSTRSDGTPKYPDVSQLAYIFLP
jgi:hypothetical protein